MYNDLTLEQRVISIVKETALIIRNARFDIIEKDGSANIVTTSDLMSQERLVKQLKELIPESGFLCEENDLKDTSKEYTWVIDPIDGTANYARGINDSCISVGLLHNRKCVLGVVCNIFLDEVYSATIDLGARLNGKAINVSKRSFSEGILCTAMSLYKKDLAKKCSDIIYEAYMQCNDVRRFGSCALELCYLASGKCDLFFEIRVFPWDYTGAYLVLNEAGGMLKGFNNQKLTFDKTTVLIGANNLNNFEKLNEIISKHLNEGDVCYE